jgi:hypothetical protein
MQSFTATIQHKSREEDRETVAVVALSRNQAKALLQFTLPDYQLIRLKAHEKEEDCTPLYAQRLWEHDKG